MLAARLPNAARFYAGDDWLAADACAARWREVASANWLATARWIAGRVPDALLIDIGSTTTDIIPIIGGRVAALPHTESAALESGRVYYLHIDTRPTRGRTTPPSYEARFCLARQHDGNVIVHQIGSGEREGRRMYGCLAPRD